MPWTPEALIDAAAEALAAQDHVRLDDAAITRLAEAAPDALLTLPAWDDPGMYDGPESQIVAWLLAYNAINYCYWRDDGRRWWTRVGAVEVGRDDEALGIMVAFGRALTDGVRLDDGAFLRGLQLEDLEALLPPADGAAPLPWMEERLAGLRELGEAYGRVGGVAGLLAAGGDDAVGLVDAIVAACPTWEDRRGAVVFRKRAQLCVSMVHGRLQGKGAGELRGVERLTAFADYRLPQILRGTGVMTLSAPLAMRIDRGDHLEKGSGPEIALRAATIVAAERLRVALQARRPGIGALVVDHLLWRLAVERQAGLPPFHRTVTTDY